MRAAAVNWHTPTARKTWVDFSPPGSDLTICVQVVQAWVFSQIHTGRAEVVCAALQMNNRLCRRNCWSVLPWGSRAVC